MSTSCTVSASPLLLLSNDLMSFFFSSFFSSFFSLFCRVSVISGRRESELLYFCSTLLRRYPLLFFNFYCGEGFLCSV